MCTPADHEWRHPLGGGKLLTRLIEDDDGIEAFARAYPGCDLQRIRALVRNARREYSEGRAPSSFRELFQALKDIVPAPDAPRPEADDIDRASP